MAEAMEATPARRRTSLFLSSTIPIEVVDGRLLREWGVVPRLKRPAFSQHYLTTQIVQASETAGEAGNFSLVDPWDDDQLAATTRLLTMALGAPCTQDQHRIYTNSAGGVRLSKARVLYQSGYQWCSLGQPGFKLG